MKTDSGSRVGGEVGEKRGVPLMALARLQLVKGLLLCATYAHGYFLFSVSVWPLILSSHGLTVYTF